MVWSRDRGTEGTYQWVVQGTAPGSGTGGGSGTGTDALESEMRVQRQEHLLMGGLDQPSDDVIQMV